ncbi:hypothetical protein MCP1_70111 [Candidatus Terasakiella magnetica]|nr:hypothetical protein MCP1_70111 [Candidatus Terasakiella magnetica]
MNALASSRRGHSSGLAQGWRYGERALAGIPAGSGRTAGPAVCRASPDHGRSNLQSR